MASCSTSYALLTPVLSIPVVSSRLKPQETALNGNPADNLMLLAEAATSVYVQKKPQPTFDTETFQSDHGYQSASLKPKLFDRKKPMQQKFAERMSPYKTNGFLVRSRPPSIIRRQPAPTIQIGTNTYDYAKETAFKPRPIAPRPLIALPPKNPIAPMYRQYENSRHIDLTPYVSPAKPKAVVYAPKQRLEIKRPAAAVSEPAPIAPKMHVLPPVSLQLSIKNEDKSLLRFLPPARTAHLDFGPKTTIVSNSIHTRPRNFQFRPVKKEPKSPLRLQSFSPKKKVPQVLTPTQPAVPKAMNDLHASTDVKLSPEAMDLELLKEKLEEHTRTCARVRPFVFKKKKRRKPIKIEPGTSFPYSGKYAALWSGAQKDTAEPWRTFDLPPTCRDIDKSPAKKKKPRKQKTPKEESKPKPKRVKGPKPWTLTCARVRPIDAKVVCARCRPYNGLRKERNSFYFMMHPERGTLYAPKERKRKQFTHGRVKGKWRVTAEMPLDVQYSRYAKGERPKLVLMKSQIHGIGVYTTESLEIGQLIIEYCGQKIRNSLVDSRENEYRAKGLGSYMFTLDNDHTVDATLSGSVARFINHSCDPSCSAKVITVQGTKHIALYANRFVTAGEELSYNYKLPYEAEKIPCLCKTPNCRKFLN